MLAIENVSFAYGRGRRVLDGVSLRVGAGEFAAVLGANGAGKSSLLKIASGYARPDVGRVMLGGADIAGLSARELARMRAVLEQECPLTFEYTVGEVVALGGYSRGGLSGLSADVSESLESVGLAGFEKRKYSELSGGEKRRVQLARALCQLGENPKLLLLDEPSAGLDPAHAHAAMSAARKVAERGAAVVAVLHDPNLAAAYADKIALLKDGKISSFGSAESAMRAELLGGVYGADCEIVSDGIRNVAYFPPKK